MATIHSHLQHSAPKTFRQFLRACSGVLVELVHVHGERVTSWLELRKRNQLRREAQTLKELSWLRDQIINTTKADVRDLLGPPPTAAEVTRLPDGGEDIFFADAWYYPFDPGQQTVLVIFFENDCASVVDLVRMPRRAMAA